MRFRPIHHIPVSLDRALGDLVGLEAGHIEDIAQRLETSGSCKLTEFDSKRPYIKRYLLG